MHEIFTLNIDMSTMSAVTNHRLNLSKCKTCSNFSKLSRIRIFSIHKNATTIIYTRSKRAHIWTPIIDLVNRIDLDYNRSTHLWFDQESNQTHCRYLWQSPRSRCRSRSQGCPRRRAHTCAGPPGTRRRWHTQWWSH